MYRAEIDENVNLEKYVTQRSIAASFPLRNLDFRLSWAIGDKSTPEMGASLTRGSLLSLVAPALERLSWSTGIENGSFHVPASQIPSFEQLRELRLSYIGFDDPGYYMALIPKLSSYRLRILEVIPDASAAATQFFESRGEILSLRTFIWERPPDLDDINPA